MSRTVKILDHREEHSPLKPIALEPLPERPLVSILISNYNYAAYLNDAIDSSLQQTYDRFEVIICDDGSTDASPRILQQYQLLDPRIRVLLQPNGGQSLALNAAFGESKGEIICLLDADDVFMPDKLQRLVSAFAAAPEAGLAVNRMLIVDGARKRLGEIPFLHQLPSGWQGSSLRMGAPHFLPAIPPCSGLSLRRSVAEAIFPLPSDLKACSDGVIQILAPMITSIVAIEVPSSEYRIHEANIAAVSAFSENQLRKLDSWHRHIWRAWRQYLVGSARCAPQDCLYPPEAAPSPMTYAYARFRCDPHAKSIYRAVPNDYFRSLPKWYQWFWRASAWMPGWLFRRSFTFLYGQPRARVAMGQMLRAYRNSLRKSVEVR
jgi:glycosyltransferase involved in cell wall biosynthesis